MSAHQYQSVPLTFKKKSSPVSGQWTHSSQQKVILHDFKPIKQLKSRNSQTPQSPSQALNIDLKNLARTQTGLIREFKAFVMGISGGDCAGKKQLMSFMFDKVQLRTQDAEYWSWKMPQTGESVAVLHQHFFIKDPTLAYWSEGTDWQLFKKKAYSLSTGNQVSISIQQGTSIKKVRIAPAKVICIEGSHIFCSNCGVNQIMNLRVFIDSDSDVRLSRRIHKDTIENKAQLEVSIKQYLTHIKPSYEKQIEPTKVNCDIIIPHFGNGYADHKIQDRSQVDLNIKNVTTLLLTQVRSAIKIYKDLQENQKASIKTEKQNF